MLCPIDRGEHVGIGFVAVDEGRDAVTLDQRVFGQFSDELYERDESVGVAAEFCAKHL